MDDPDKMTYEKAIYLLENDGEVDGDDEFMTAYWMAVEALREKSLERTHCGLEQRT